jgi:hypothetical protein
MALCKKGEIFAGITAELGDSTCPMGMVTHKVHLFAWLFVQAIGFPLASELFSETSNTRGWLAHVPLCQDGDARDRASLGLALTENDGVCMQRHGQLESDAVRCGPSALKSLPTSLCHAKLHGLRIHRHGTSLNITRGYAIVQISIYRDSRAAQEITEV